MSAYDPQQLILGSLRNRVRDLDPSALTDEEAVAQLDWFAAVQRFASAGMTVLAPRVAASRVWENDGARSPADWLASRTGTPVGHARAVIDTGNRLDDAPGTQAALRAGELSPAQAEHISLAAAADPEEEARLLAMRRTHSLRKLKDECARVRLAADPDPEGTRLRIHRGRYWRRWTDADGSRCGSYRLTPEQGAELEALAQPFIDQRLDEARQGGEREPSEAYAADGLLDMARAASGGGDVPVDARGGRGRKRFRDRRELIALVNLESLRRGSVERGEVCEIAGVGPVSLHVVRELFGDALLRIVIRDAADVRTVVHAGRTANDVQETAVFARSMGLCEVDGCDLAISEIDHGDDFARAGPATLAGLAGLCGHHHDAKSAGRGTWRARGDGRIVWIPPP